MYGYDGYQHLHMMPSPKQLEDPQLPNTSISLVRGKENLALLHQAVCNHFTQSFKEAINNKFVAENRKSSIFISNKYVPDHFIVGQGKFIKNTRARTKSMIA